MNADGWRAFALRGAHVEQALGWLHVHAELQGVLEDADEVVVWLRGALPELPAGLDVELEERPVDDAQFGITGLENDAAIVVADDLLVRPPWVERPSGFDGFELVVPRGNAFGSGEHDSTRAALLVLHTVVGRTRSPLASAADVGCGSGILALYLAQRGCGALEACDIDAPSVAAAAELLPDRSRVVVGGPERLRACDLVVANMTGDELSQALDAILAIWTRRGALVLGGMRAHEVAGLLARVLDAGTREVHRREVGAFTAVAFEARADQAVR